MNKLETFEQFLATGSGQISLVGFVINLLLAAVLAYFIGVLYVRYGRSLSNRRAFARNFLQITLTTMFIITVVKSSLALSLGLVGALSIVRFRAAIKEPEELGYLFLAIAVGLGLGADQRAITLVAFAGIAAFTVIAGRSRADDGENLHLTVTSESPDKVSLERMLEVLREHCSAVKMKRLDDAGEVLEASFLVEYESVEALQASQRALQALDGSVRVSFLDNRGLG